MNEVNEVKQEQYLAAKGGFTSMTQEERRKKGGEKNGSIPNFFRRKDKEWYRLKRAWTRDFWAEFCPGSSYRLCANHAEPIFSHLALLKQMQRFLEELEKMIRILDVSSLNYFQFYIRDRTANRIYWLNQCLPLTSIFHNHCHS